MVEKQLRLLFTLLKMLKQEFIREALRASQEVKVMLEDCNDIEDYLPQEIGAGGDATNGLDLKAEAIYVKRLGKFGRIESEESGSIGEGEDVIVLDPIDGSDNTLTHFPYYGASIALVRDGKTIMAIVCNFANSDVFIKDDTNFMHGKLNSAVFQPVQIHHTSKVGIFEKAPIYPDVVKKLMDNKLKFRGPGAVALSLAYAHYVNFVIFLGKMRPYDLKAGLFMCEDLHIYEDEEALIISKDLDVFNRLKTIILEDT